MTKKKAKRAGIEETISAETLARCEKIDLWKDIPLKLYNIWQMNDKGEALAKVLGVSVYRDENDGYFIKRESSPTIVRMYPSWSKRKPVRTSIARLMQGPNSVATLPHWEHLPSSYATGCRDKKLESAAQSAGVMLEYTSGRFFFSHPEFGRKELQRGANNGNFLRTFLENRAG